jgi:hypothetical protein
MVDTKRIEQMAQRVHAQYAEQQEAYAAERAAEAAVLEAAIAAARPALRALVGRIVREERTVWHDNAYTSTERDYHEERGVAVAGSGPERLHPRDTDGRWGGHTLYLIEDGRLAKVAWGGTWTKWQGRGSTLTGELRIYESVLACIEDGWDAEEAVAGLAAALERQASGKAPERAAKARERAERLASVAKLMK